MIKITRQAVALMMGLGIILTALPAAPVYAASPTPAIARTKKQIIAMTDAIDGKEDKISDLTDSIEEAGRKIMTNEKKVSELKQEVASTVVETEKTKVVLTEKQDHYAKRLREVYKNGTVSTISAILDARNIADLFLRYKVVQNIARHDKELIDSIQTLKADLEAKADVLRSTQRALETATGELKDDQADLTAQKKNQEARLSELRREKADLRALLESQEIALFSDIERILNSAQSSESEVKEALAILDIFQSQVSTPEAIALGKQLTAQGNDLAKKLKAARLEAERLAKEKAEAEREARELEAKRKAAKKQRKAEEARKIALEQEKAAKIAAQKETDRLAAEARTRKLEKEKQEQEADAKRLAAKEAEAKKTADKARKLSTSARTTAKSAPKQTKKASSSTKTNNLTFYLSFYTDLPEENGGWTITATGDKLTYGVVANNVWPMYTKIYLDGWGTMTVKDRGGKDFYSRYRLDVFIPRRSGESNRQYLYRVNMMGRKTVKGRVLD